MDTRAISVWGIHRKEALMTWPFCLRKHSCNAPPAKYPLSYGIKVPLLSPPSHQYHYFIVTEMGEEEEGKRRLFYATHTFLEGRSQTLALLIEIGSGFWKHRVSIYVFESLWMFKKCIYSHKMCAFLDSFSNFCISFVRDIVPFPDLRERVFCIRISKFLVF